MPMGLSKAINRRNLLRAGLASACSVAAAPWITPIAMAAVPGDNRLVVIILRGAMDGLDIVRPVEDPNLAEYRPTLAKAEIAGDLGGGFALHADLADLMPMYRAGGLGFAHAVSTPYRDKRSHFDGQDILEAGTPGLEQGTRDGWLNRLLALIPGAVGETAFSVGREQPLILSGRNPFQSWAPASSLQITPQARLLLERVYHDDPLFNEAGMTAFDLAEELSFDRAVPDGETPAMQMAAGQAGSKPGKADQLAAFAAARLNGDTRIAAFSLVGWDTHRNQEKALRGALGPLRQSLLRLQMDLGRNWDKTVVLAMTEFGRTARENGSRGTDHGTGGLMVLAGGAARGGQVYGRWPGLADGDLYVGRDLMPTEDVRAYAAKALEGQFGVSRSDLERLVFPGLDMGQVPQFL